MPGLSWTLTQPGSFRSRVPEGHARNRRPGLASIRAQIDKIREVTGLPVLYATEALASFERERLIEQKVPFVVPGNQLYLPHLGVDLR